MPLTLKGKIALNMWFLAAVCSLIAGVAGGWLLLNSQQKTLEETLKNTAASLMAIGISSYSGLEGFQQLDAFIEDNLHISKTNEFIQVYTRRGKLMFSSKSAVEAGFDPPFKPIGKPFFARVKMGEKKFKMLTTPYRAKTGKQYFLRVALPLPAFLDVAKTTFIQALILFVILSLLAYLIAQILAKKLALPIETVADYLNRLNPTELHESQILLLPKKDEYLRAIANGINNLRRRVRSSIYSLSRTSRYLAHELRNPLAILSGEAQTVLAKKSADKEDYRGILKSSLEEIDRLNNVVTAVLEISRHERTVYRTSPIDLAAWLDEQVPRWKKFLGRGLAWNKPAESMIVVLDPELLYRLLDNLMRNIKEHTPADTMAAIRLERAGNGVKITVEDNGPGLPALLLNDLNEGSYGGIGLGLCQEIASICDFKLVFANKEGKGLQVTLGLC